MNYISPRDYILSGSYHSLNITGKEFKSDLEKAVVGYVIISSVGVRGRTYKKSASYSQLHELIFEHIKSNSPDEITKRLRGNIDKLQAHANIDYLSQKTRDKIKEKIQYFANLLTRPVSEISYNDFEPRGWGMLIAPSGTTPFMRYCNDIISALVEAQMLVKDRKLGPHYTRYKRVNRRIVDSVALNRNI